MKYGVELTSWEDSQYQTTQYRVKWFDKDRVDEASFTFDNYALRMSRTEAPIAIHQKFEREIRNGTVAGERRWKRLEPFLLDQLGIRL